MTIIDPSSITSWIALCALGLLVVLSVLRAVLHLEIWHRLSGPATRRVIELVVRRVFRLALFVVVVAGGLEAWKRYIDAQGIDATSADETPLQMLTARVLGSSIVDVLVRNMGEADAVIHRAHFIVDKIECRPGDGVPHAFPCTCQYDAVLDCASASVDIDVAQAVPGKKSDRFQFAFVLGEERQDPGSPWGDAYIAYLSDNEKRRIVKARATVTLRLHYNDGATVMSGPLDLQLVTPAFGFRARKQAGVKLSDKLRLLDDEDINVVESVVRSLRDVRDATVTEALHDLEQRNLAYLQVYYEQKIHRQCDDPSIWYLPDPQARFAEFRKTLRRTIEAHEQ